MSTGTVTTILPAAKDPPTKLLPPLPSAKPRRCVRPLNETSSKRDLPNNPRPSASPAPQHPLSTPTVPTLRSVSSLDKASTTGPNKIVRKTVSIASFPQPPNVRLRQPQSTIPFASSMPPPEKMSGDTGAPSTQGSYSRAKRPSRVSTAALVGSIQYSQTPSLLNKAGDGKSITIPASQRISDGQNSNPSPSHSRNSSAAGSYSTSATTFEDADDLLRGRTREEGSEGLDSKTNSQGKEAKGNVVVSVRVRPDAAGQDPFNVEREWMVDGKRSLVAYWGKEGGEYRYDNVFVAHDNNARVFDSSAKRLVRRVMEGYHGTVFAYGMTGTGKTFSMQGTATNPGVIPLAITDIFSYIRETPHREFLLRVSYLEIYNEKIHDLLSTPAANSPVSGAGQQEEIKLREDSKRGVYATPLKEEIVQSPTQLLRVIARGDHARRTSSTQYNVRSSRSHAVVQIVVESRERAAPSGTVQSSKKAAISPGGVRVSTLSLIDLAGSERAAETKERRTEGAHINKSLLTLGTVIARLSGDKDKSGKPTDKDGKHLPYRDSKLTRLLQPALSGDSLVSILCTIQLGPHGSAATANNHTGETLNTLKFAARAKNNIVSHAKRAEEALGSGGNAGLLERYRAEIVTLRGQLEGQQKAEVEKEERQLEKEAAQRHEEQMLEMQLARTALKERIEHLNRLILCSKSSGVNAPSSGTTSALGMHSRVSSSQVSDAVIPRSIRSSASQSTIGTNGQSFSRIPSMTSLGPSQHMSLAPVNAEEEEEVAGGDFGDGVASLQAQNRALQADLQDKNRYIATLEKRLLQARRSSQSRVSMALAPHKAVVQDESTSNAQLVEKDAEIADLRARLDDQERMVTALRSASRKRQGAEMSCPSSTTEYWNASHGSNDSIGSSTVGTSVAVSKSPMGILSPRKDHEQKKKSVDEMSKMLDEMIQDKVESGHLVKGWGGSVRVALHSRRLSSNGRATPVPGLT